ncbi:hypothetical protein XO10_08675 [Marinitoga sp. 1135]|uniref:Uncharacterized protein n=1 Tax=Marinitoga piezophila (strain DSM 14283 / JCM 11233 / KA3) TaxID=443254 RepID=H2J5K1_MARPK|nr:MULTISPECIES: hypothetical protein [Marinitoga]AEX86145.1 hypothetical protein Marpi_1760 [Marinitoga piezophila KA3]NUU96329.1 hypothetical protein [Marinitoga sp. 1135]NUU98247.1 hypothetical protein [Marinitoga sp. 1138]
MNINKKFFLFFIIFIPVYLFSLNLGIYSDGIFLEETYNNVKVKGGYPTFGVSYFTNTSLTTFDITADFNLDNPQLNNYVSATFGIKTNNLNIYSGISNTFNEISSRDSTTTANIGNIMAYSGILLDSYPVSAYLQLNLKTLNWIKTGDIITTLPAIRGTFEDTLLITFGIKYKVQINANNIIIFFNFGSSYISFPNGLTLYQFQKKYNFGVLVDLNEIINTENREE